MRGISEVIHVMRECCTVHHERTIDYSCRTASGKIMRPAVTLFVNSTSRLSTRRAAFSRGSWISAGRRTRRNELSSPFRTVTNDGDSKVDVDSTGNVLPSFTMRGMRRSLDDNKSNFARRDKREVVALQKDYVRRIKHAGLQGDWREAQRLLSDMQAGGVPRNLFTYNAAISALGRCGRAVDAEALLSVMMDIDGLIPDIFSFNTSISAYARRGNMEAAERVLKRMREYGVKPDRYTFNMIADAAAKRGDSTSAANVLALMAEEGVVPDLITYNSCLAACARNGDLRRAKALLELMREDGIAPDNRSYCAVISAAGRKGEWFEVLRQLEDMRREGVEPDLIAFNAAITAVGSSGQSEAAIALMEDMKRAGLNPNTVTYTAVMGAHSRAGDWRLVLGVLEDMRAAGIPPNLFSYSTAMDACGKAGEKDEALRLLDDMHSEEIVPDTVVYNSAIDACSVKADWSTALKLLEEMKHRIRGAAPPDVVSYGGAITACARAGRANQALQLMAELRANEVRATEAAVRGRTSSPLGSRGRGPGRGAEAALPLPNLITYSATLYACLKAGEVHRGGEVLEEMIAAGFQPNNIHCDTVIAAWSAAGQPERAFSAMKRLQSLGFAPSLNTYEALVWGFAQVADWAASIRLLAAVLRAGLKPSTRSWDAAIAACSQAGHGERALSLLGNMVRQGVRPSRVTYNAAVAGLNRPRHSDWGPKLERLSRLLQDRAEAPGDDPSSLPSRVEDVESVTGLPIQVGRQGRQPGEDKGQVSSIYFKSSAESLEETGNVDGVSSLISLLRQEGLHTYTRAYRSIIYACARVGLLAEAVALAKEMESEGKKRRQLRLKRQGRDGVSSDVDVSTVSPGGRTVSDVPAPTEVAPSEAGNMGSEIADVVSSGADAAGTHALLLELDEPDMALVYNCIACNFARAATQGSLSRDSKKGEVGDTPPSAEGTSEPSAASRSGQDREGDPADLMSLLLDLAKISGSALLDDGREISDGVEDVENTALIAHATDVDTVTGRDSGKDPGSRVPIFA